MRLRQPGRPAGAEARSKRQLREHLAQLGYRDPAVVLAETMSMSEAAIQNALNRNEDGTAVPALERCSRKEAHAIRLRAAAELLPFVHGKMPTIELQPEEALPVLVIEVGTNQLDIDRGRIDGGRAAEPMSVGLPMLENQGVTDGATRPSHGATVSRERESEADQRVEGDHGVD
ncbi:hypothetical protein ACEUEL_01755 [Ancylobacter sp. sgz301288]